MRLNNNHRLLLFLFSLIVLNTWAQSPQADLFKERPEICFAFKVADKAAMNALTKMISIDQVYGDSIFAYANRMEFSTFLTTGIPYVLKPAPSTLSYIEMHDPQKKASYNWDTYLTYEQFEQTIDTLSKNYSSICRVDTIYTLPSGRRILALHISNNPQTVEAEPNFLYLGSIHGDETAGYILLLRLAHYLLSNYNSDAFVNDLVNTTAICLVPLPNPDGTYASGNHTVYGATRSNVNGIDLNRNFPDRFMGQNPDGHTRQLETTAFMNFDKKYAFNMSGTIHGGAEVVNYPWDNTATLHADDSWWRYVSRCYADTVQAHSIAPYFTDFDNGITNGYAWYSVYGGRQDYLNYFNHCREVTLELNNTKTIAANDMNKLWEYQHRSLLHYLNASHQGITGVVLDSVSGKPIRANITIMNHDKDSSNVYSSAKTGAFFRPISPGIYSVQVEAPGYVSKIYDSIEVDNNMQAYLSAPLVTAISTDMSSNNDLTIKQIDNDLYVLSYAKKVPCQLTLYSVNGQEILTKKVTTNVNFSLPTLNNGMYLLQLKTPEFVTILELMVK